MMKCCAPAGGLARSATGVCACALVVTKVMAIRVTEKKWFMVFGIRDRTQDRIASYSIIAKSSASGVSAPGYRLISAQRGHRADARGPPRREPRSNEGGGAE